MFNIQNSKFKIQKFLLCYSPFTNKLIFSFPQTSQLITHNSSLITQKNIYLTFDDGPNSGTTEFIIESLNKFNAKATFFCIGNNIEKYPQTFGLYSQNGHSIGNHTYSHLNGWKTDNSTYYNDIIKCQFAISNTLSLFPSPNGEGLGVGFRPPYGKIKISQISHLRKFYKIYLWSVISYDFDLKTSKERCLKNVLNNTKEGSIVVFHDSNKASKNLFFTLPRVLEHFSEKAFSFKSLTS